jgi:hypothetical protein
MTADEWLILKVGDVLIDAKCQHARREVLTVSRVSGKPGQRGKTRTTITVQNLHSAGRTTIVVNCEDVGGERFALAGSSRPEV